MIHEPRHELVMAVAAAILVVGGGCLLVLAWRARLTGGSAALLPEPPDTPVRVVRAVVAALSVAAAVVHVAAAPIHLEELGIWGLGFVLAGVFQASWALAWRIEPAPGVVRIGLAGNAAFVIAWLTSRTFGLPLGAGMSGPEAIGVADGVTVALEVALLALLLRPPTGRRFSALASVALVPIMGVVLLATTLAVAAVGGGHEHDAGWPHPPSPAARGGS